MLRLILPYVFLLFNLNAYSIDLVGDYTGDRAFVPDGEDKLYYFATDYLFTENSYDLYFYNEEYGEKGTWSVETKNHNYYIKFRSDSCSMYKDQLGILFHERRLYLYDNDKLFFASNDGIRFGNLGPRVESIKSSSYLKEKNIEYMGDNIINHFLDDLRPWVEGVNGQGIGEWIEIKTNSFQFPVDFFLISNGYVDFEKPYLYEYNSRVKLLRITNEELNIDFEVELEDTPNFQEIRLPKEITELETTFRFTIMEVYTGTKWEDTCLNLIIPLGDLPNEK